jgi:rhamnosyltransferase
MTTGPTAAIVVTYHPSDEMILRLPELLSQVDSLVVVDNGSPQDKRSGLREALNDPRCILIELDRNAGVAAALNHGVSHALAQGSQFVLLLDQDSQCEPGFVSAFQAATDDTRLSDMLYSPLHISRKTGEPMVPFYGADGTPFIVITAGTFFHRSLYERVGPFDESLFIDMVDDEYCLRLRRIGGTIQLVRDATLVHEVGDPEQHVLFGRYTFDTLNHSAKRRYFIVRNRLLVLKQHFADYPRYTAFILYLTMMETMKIALVPTDRAKRLRLSFKGWVDGLLNRRGNRVGL